MKFTSSTITFTGRSAIGHLSCLAALLMATILFPLSATAQGGGLEGRIRVQLTPFQQTTLSSEIPANISKLPLRDGETFREGQQLVEFDCSLLNAQSRSLSDLQHIA